MAFTDKDDAITNMNSPINNDTQPHLTPVGTTNRIRATNLKNWLTEFLNWVFPAVGTDLKGKSPVVTGTGTDYTAISWIQLVPTGSVLPWAGSATTPPDGFLFCDGTTKTQATFPELFATIGNNYGSAPAGDFRLPNMEGRVPLGFEQGDSTTPSSNPSVSQTNYGKVGNSGGFQGVSLNTNQMPSHNHGNGTLATSTDGSHTHPHSWSRNTPQEDTANTGKLNDSNSDAVKDGLPTALTIGFAGNHDHDVIGSTGLSGGNNQHENRQPYVVMKYIIKT